MMQSSTVPRKRRVLLVSGEPSRFASLGESGRTYGDWDVVFAGGPGPALAEVGRAPVDALVLDGRLPQASRTSLLADVRNAHPLVARLVVWDHARSDKRPSPVGVVEVAGSTVAELATQIERSCRLQEVVGSDAVREVVGRIDQLPAVSRTCWQLMQAISNPDVGLEEVARLVESDPAISLKVLQLVNSALFGLARRTASIREAVRYLGVELLRVLVLTANLFSAAKENQPRGLSMEVFQSYSIRMARLTRKLVADPSLSGDAFTAGFVHDIGKVIIALKRPVEFEQIVARVGQDGESQHAVEVELLSVSHTDVGAYFLDNWSIPFLVVEATAFHHDPDRAVGSAQKVLAALHAADALTGIVYCGEPEERLNMAFIERVGLAGELPRWRSLVEEDGVT